MLDSNESTMLFTQHKVRLLTKLNLSWSMLVTLHQHGFNKRVCHQKSLHFCFDLRMAHT